MVILQILSWLQLFYFCNKNKVRNVMVTEGTMELGKCCYLFVLCTVSFV